VTGTAVEFRATPVEIRVKKVIEVTEGGRLMSLSGMEESRTRASRSYAGKTSNQADTDPGVKQLLQKQI